MVVYYSGFRQGLSPRVRGNLHLEAAQEAPGGSIPACAGEPNPVWPRLPSRAVYPRVCGGTQRPPHTRRRGGGLSPRVRGNPLPVSDADQPLRSIPACAGEPSPAQALSHGTKVYPRVCGGTGSCAGPQQLGWGLSPRVRGNQSRVVDQPARQGSIPACAGEPTPPSAN